MAGPDSIRTVITGVGVVSPIGIGRDAFWSGLMSGHSGIDFLQSFSADNLPSCLAAEITDFDPAEDEIMVHYDSAAPAAPTVTTAITATGGTVSLDGTMVATVTSPGLTLAELDAAVSLVAV